MDNIADLLKILSSAQSIEKEQTTQIPKEIIDQYPYGDFPIRYTRVGQETIRKNSEARFSHPITENINQSENQKDDLDITTILSLTSLLSNKNKKPKDIFEIFSTILFKDKPELKKILGMFSKTPKSNNINNCENFPETNKVSISSLKKVE